MKSERTIKETPRPFGWHLPALLLLVLTTAMAYSGALGNDFIVNWDDYDYVINNEAVTGFSLEHLQAAFTRFFVGHYSPLQIVSYMLDYEIWGPRPVGFILTNILIHLGCGLLVYRLLFRLYGRVLPALVAGFVFLAHPVQVESVAWVSQRKTVLAMFFMLLAIDWYLSYRERAGRGATCYYLLSVASFGAALLVKSLAVVLPPALLLFDLCVPVRGERRLKLLDKLPYLAAAAVISGVAFVSQSPEMTGSGGRTGWHGGSPWGTFLTMLPVLVAYLRLLAWPVGLSAYYDPQIRTSFDVAVLLGAVVLVMLVGVGFILYRRRRDLFFWYAFFFLGLLPVAQIVPLISLMSDRYLYVPLLGSAALTGLLADRLLETPRWGKILCGACCCLLLALPVLARQRTSVWRDAVTLWSDTAPKTPNNLNAWTFLVESWFEGGRLEAVPLPFRQNPNFRRGIARAFAMYVEKGKLFKAQLLGQELVRAYPDLPDGYLGLGVVALLGGDGAGAARAFQEGSNQLREPGSGPLVPLARVLIKKGNYPLAGELLQQAQAFGDTSAELAYAGACLQAATGRPEEALMLLEIAARKGYPLASSGREPCFTPLRGRPEFQRLVTMH